MAPPLRTNPYTRKYGDPPPVLAGRTLEREDFGRLLDGTGLSLLIYGRRGLGKTVLLRRFRDVARARQQSDDPRGKAAPRKWIVSSEQFQLLSPNLNIEVLVAHVSADLIAMINPRSKAHAPIKSFLASIDEVSGSVGVLGASVSGSLKRTRMTAQQAANARQHVIEMLSNVASEAKQFGYGVLLFFDEAQYLDPASLAALLAGVATARGINPNLGLVIAGLPSLPSQCSDAFDSSHTLFDSHELERLTREEAEAALVEPKGAKRFEADALARVIELTDGYPIFIQTYGYFLWDRTVDEVITLADVDRIVPEVRGRLLRNFYGPKWDKCSKPAKRMLAAASSLSGPIYRQAEVARIAKIGRNKLPEVRQELLDRGLIYETDDDLANANAITFALAYPLFDAFIQENHPL